MTTTLTTEEETLKAHMAPDGIVWYLDGKSSPRSSERRIDDFLGLKALRGRAIRVLGTHLNAALITQLHKMRREGVLQSVHVAGPLVCETAAEREDPGRALFRMRQCVWAGSVGGWHPLTDKEFITYAMYVQRLADNDQPSEAQTALMTQHPAWPDVAFIKTLNIDECYKLLVSILDPRFYVNHRRPNRSGKLMRYLGLTPATQLAAMSGHLGPATNRRCIFTLQSWATGVPDKDPRCFISRVYSYYVNMKKVGDVKAALRASQTFVRYLRYTWLSQLTPLELCGGEVLFCPKTFFRHEDEVQAYRAWPRA